MEVLPLHTYYTKTVEVVDDARVTEVAIASKAISMIVVPATSTQRLVELRRINIRVAIFR